MVPLRTLAGESRQPSHAKTAAATDAQLGSRASAAVSALSNGARTNAAPAPGASLFVHAALLSAVAGYVDAAGFVSLVGLFPAHLTGELVGDAIALSSGHLGHGHGHLWAVPVFVCAVGLATVVARVLRHHGLQARAGVLALVTLALTLFSASDALAWLLHEGQLPFFVRGGFAVAAMGFQSALMRESLTKSCPTTVMTGNLTQVVIDLVDHLIRRVVRPIRGESNSRSPSLVLSALGIFAFSAALGGWLARTVGSISVAVPAAVTFALMLRAWRDDFEPHARDTQAIAPAPPNRRAQPWPEATELHTSDDHAWPIEPYSVDFSSHTRIKSEPIVGESAPSKDAADQRKPRSISGTRLIELEDRD